MSVLEKLTEGIINRDVSREGQAVLTKWEKTGLLEGLNDDRTRQNMAVLLENQAKELLREASSMAAGDVEGFAAVAFPIVRRVFGGLIANELVSVQPMSLPSGLIFFLDFTKADADRQGAAGESLYGGGVVASQLTGGVNLSGRDDQGGFYSLSTGYSNAKVDLTGVRIDIGGAQVTDATSAAQVIADGGASKDLDFDADLEGKVCIVINSTHAEGLKATASEVDPGTPQSVQVKAISDPGGSAAHAVDAATGDLLFSVENAGVGAGVGRDHALALRLVRRHTQFVGGQANGIAQATGIKRLVFEVVAIAQAANDDGIPTLTSAGIAALEQLEITEAAVEACWDVVDASQVDVDLTMSMKDDLTTGAGLGSIKGQDQWGLEEPFAAIDANGALGRIGKGGSDDSNKNVIPEIDIKVDSVAVTAQTKKLKAKWTPELAQDLNAYHNLDAEVELTGILSEQIALEIDQEILGDLIRGATASTLYWSRHPGKFVNRATGADLTNDGLSGPDFTGTVSEWYETLIETINDVSAQIHRKTLRGGANFLVCSPEIANILEFTSGFRARATHDQEKGQVGAVNVGSLSKKFDVYVDPYFLRNVILVGRKGSSFLESGFVYAPYVPLQTTPTIFGTEDFVPRKGVMTRYAKKMVRPDLYGLVVVADLLG
tara:strand:+ start:5296 stop:7278 length:1983 start_codon:yes stop_codon:yes gene_type:complete